MSRTTQPAQSLDPRAPPTPHRGRRRDVGSASIEFAITAVAVMAVIFTAIQAATWFWARSNGLTGTTITVTTTTGGVQATVTGHCLTVLPGFCNAFPVTATVHGTTEKVTP
jgi:hypothetical protein